MGTETGASRRRAAAPRAVIVNARDLDLGTDLLGEPGPAGHRLREAGCSARRPVSPRLTSEPPHEVQESIPALLARNSNGPSPAALRLSRPGGGR